MKFTDGCWKMRPGVLRAHPAEVCGVEVEPDAMTVYAPCKFQNRRGDSVGGPLFTVRFSSPMADVIRVQMFHHKGTPRTKPDFELREQPDTPVTIRDDAQAAALTSGRLTVRVVKGGDWKWAVEFRDGDRLLTSSSVNGMGLIDAPDGRFMHEQLGLGVGECVYGLGERFTAFVKNGQVADMWNADGGTFTEQAYKNIPFYMTNRGYGVFVNHPERVSFEVASEKVERVQFSVPGEYLEYFVFAGPTPKDVLRKYTALTGRPALPPAWSFGLWLTTSFTPEYDEKTVTGFIQGMADRDVPLHVFHFDSFWMKPFHWCDLEWDEKVFPDPKAMLKRFHERGLHICCWLNPYVAQRSRLFAEGQEHGYLLKRPDGSVWQTDEFQAGTAIVDFTNPAACSWFGDKLRALVDMGVDCFKTDFGERIPTDVVYHDGSDPLKMHNYYSQLYNKTVFETLRGKLGEGQAVVFARSATAGGQQFPVHWGGDCAASFESMAESLRGGLSLGMSGFGFWSHDIGGFEGKPSADVYKRWCAFGLLSSHSRLHGNSSFRVPWLFDEEAVDVLRFFTKLKCRLMPYIFGLAGEAHETGVPIMRAMPVEFPGDPACDTLDRQYMLGESLLVAPVLSRDGVVDFYLPPGRWTNFLSNESVEGGRWIRQQHGYLSLPLLARPNSLIPVGSQEQRPDYDYANGVTIHAFDLQDGATLTANVPSVTGKEAVSIEVRREGRTLRVQARGAAKPWRLLLRGVGAVEKAEGGNASVDAMGTLVTPFKGADTVTVWMNGHDTEKNDGAA